MTGPAAEWGLPDWLDARDYGDTRRWTEGRWRWEFTRRREDFRADFDVGAECTEKHYRALYTKMFGPAARVLTRHDPGFHSATSVEQVCKYGTALFNPRIADQPRLSFQAPLTKTGVTLGSGDFFSPSVAVMSVPNGAAAVRIHLDRPIAPQLAGAMNYLSFLQMERHGKQLQSRRNPRTWLRYLRVLDGRECKASWRGIYEAVLADKKSHNQNPAQDARRVWQGAQHLMFNWPC